MALNLNTLTSSATSGDVLQEATTTADFLENVPVFRNIARGSNKGGDAKQGTALNQPRALPLIDGDGYCYTSGVNGNYASLGATVLPATANFDLSIDFVFKGPVTDGLVELFYQYDSGDGRFIMGINDSNELRVFWGPVGGRAGGTIIEGQKHTARLVRSGSNFTLSLDGTSIQTWTSSDAISQVPSLLGYGVASNRFFKGGIFKVTEGSNYTCDFTATKVRHGDTKFKCATNQVVTINTSGLDPAKIIKRPVLRFDGVNDGLQGLFANNINGGYMFAAFSVLGDGGESYARVFTTSLAGTGNDYDGAGAAFLLRNAGTTNLATIASGGTVNIQGDMFDDASGDILTVVKIENESQTSDVNNASYLTNNRTTAINSNEFNIAFDNASSSSACIDLEFLALFPASITDDQADDVRNYINNRNNVFDLKDGFGYYFFDAQKAPVGAISSGSSAWNGRIVGSDNGDADKLATQSTANDQPVSDGYVVTFADNSDHLDIPSTSQAGWQIVGTSLGTFAYRVDNDAVTELNLLGNFGNASVRRAGDLYGVMLLPLSASSADIESAKRLLIDRGAAESATASDYYASWYGRVDIIEFGQADTSSITAIGYAWFGCNNMTKFAALDLSNCTNFSSAWRFTGSLGSFPAGAKLGTAASNVNFTSAWQSSGLTSFPALDLSAGTNFNQAFYQATSLEEFGQCDFSNASSFDLCWYYCSALTTFPSMQLPSATSLNSTWMGCSSLTNFGKFEAPNVTVFRFTWSGSGITTIEDGTLLGTSASSVDFTSAFKNCTALTTLPANLNLSKGDDFQTAFQNCQSLVNFPANAFDTMGTPQDYCFLNTWLDNNALSAASVENILVSINTSGQSAPSTGPEITIKYNTATGTPAYSTLASLKSKGWVVIVNGVTL